MPFIENAVYPRHIGRASAPTTHGELADVTNLKLSNVLRQLSVLSGVANDLFDYYSNTMRDIHNRTVNVRSRIETVTRRLATLKQEEDAADQDAACSHIPEEIALIKPFRSAKEEDHQLLSVSNRPKTVVEVYSGLEPPPNLSILNYLREDEQDALKLYTNPSFFFELWAHQMKTTADSQYRRARKSKKQRQSDVRGKKAVKHVQPHYRKYETMKHGPEFSGPARQRMDINSSGPDRSTIDSTSFPSRDSTWTVTSEGTIDSKSNVSLDSLGSADDLSPSSKGGKSRRKRAAPKPPNASMLPAPPPDLLSNDSVSRAQYAGSVNSLSSSQADDLSFDGYMQQQQQQQFPNVPPAPPPPPPPPPPAPLDVNANLPKAGPPDNVLTGGGGGSGIPPPPAPPPPLLSAADKKVVLPAQKAPPQQEVKRPQIDARSDLLAAIRTASPILEETETESGIHLRKTDRATQREKKAVAGSGSNVAHLMELVDRRRHAFESSSDEDVQDDDAQWSDDNDQ